MKNIIRSFAVWLLDIVGYKAISVPKLSEEFLESTRLIMSQAEAMGGSGEFRRAQVMRAMMNRHPEARERDIALAIEMQICGL